MSILSDWSALVKKKSCMVIYRVILVRRRKMHGRLHELAQADVGAHAPHAGAPGQNADVVLLRLFSLAS